MVIIDEGVSPNSSNGQCIGFNTRFKVLEVDNKNVFLYFWFAHFIPSFAKVSWSMQ